MHGMGNMWKHSLFCEIFDLSTQGMPFVAISRQDMCSNEISISWFVYQQQCVVTWLTTSLKKYQSQKA